MLIMPIITIFFQDNGLTLSQIFLLQSIFSIVIFGFEVPTGYFWDVVGKRISLIIWTVLWSMWFRIYTISYDFRWFMIAEIFIWIGYTFISWSDSALLYDTLLELKKEKIYKYIEGKKETLASYSQAIGAVIGGIVAASFWLRSTFIINAILVSAAIPVIRTIVEPHIHRAKDPSKNLWANLQKTIKYALRENKKLLLIILFSWIISISTLSIVRATQPYLELIGVPIVYFGFIRAWLRLVVWSSSFFAWRYDEKVGFKKAMISLLLLTVSGYILMWLVGSLRWILVLVIFQIVRWLQVVLTKQYINETIQSHMRATVLSVEGMIGRLMFAWIWPIIWWMSDLRSLQTALIYTWCFFLVFGLITLLLMYNNNIFTKIK